MKIEYTHESDFKTELVEIDDNHYATAKKLYDAFGNMKSGILVHSDKKSLIFGVHNPEKNDTRVDREIGKNIYRIKIEKII